MRATRYYQLSLVLPFAVPAVVWGPLVLCEELFGVRIGPALPGLVDFSIMVLGGSVILGGFAYALFAIASLVALRRRGPLAHRRFAIAAPPLFLLVLFLWNLVAASLEGTLKLYDPLQLFGGLAAFVLPLGYLYVALCFLGYRALSKRGVVHA